MKVSNRFSKKRNIVTAANLGFGSQTGNQGTRFMDKNGKFLIHRTGIPFFQIFDSYQWLMTTSWTTFFVIVVSFYIVINTLFALLYFFIGTEYLEGSRAETMFEHFMEAFFFSSHTITTVGYGSISPRGFLSQSVAAIESFLGLLSFALVTGLLYGRFSRPVAYLLYSPHAIVAPYKSGRGFMFRVANKKNSLLSEVHAQVTLARTEINNGIASRKFYRLPLEYDTVNFLTIGWTINHPVNEDSPLYGVSQQEFEQSDAEFLVLLNGFDNTFSQNVQSTHSYKWHEFLWGHKFTSMYERDLDSEYTLLHLDRIGNTMQVQLPELPISESPLLLEEQ
ncbi:MAG TPA: ion channel [Candidatus Kapabacteria bacterium]|nr:ion channel [Candidatus Kapabacteria bacterium]